MDSQTQGPRALVLGNVKLRIMASEATFVGEPDPGVTHVVRQDLVLIGRGDEAAARLVGPAAADVSRIHLLLQAGNHSWTVHDRGSANGTREWDADERAWRTLQPQAAVPVSDGLLLVLADTLQLRFELLPARWTGTTTPRRDPGGGPATLRIRPAELEDFARALVAQRDSAPSRPPSVVAAGRAAYAGRTAAYERFKALRGLPEVRLFLTGDDPGSVADAAVRAFPYLRGAQG
ncbi:MAG TPA: FHA domain-containing protein [Acidimicrobiales bacterium]|nr:FHA domain-containing protein [Acidimicrobiales bacterium]